MKKHIELHAATGGDSVSENEGISKCAGCGLIFSNDELIDAAQDIGGQIEHFEPCDQLFEHPEGYYLPRELTHSLENQIELRLLEIEPGAPYSLKKICGKDYWKSLSKLERRIAPACVNFLIGYEELPLELERFSVKNGYMYRVN